MLVLMFLALGLEVSPGFDGIVPDGAKVTKVAGGFAFTEGPVCDRTGELYFSDIPREHIIRLDAGGRAAVWREKSGGSNGLMFDRKGRLVACEGKARRLTRTGPDGRIEVLADRYQGKKLNSPNDLAIDPGGRIFFTDPRYGRRDDLELDVEAVYRVDPDGKIARVIDDLKKPNGIIISPGADFIYVADNGASCVYRYPLRGDGTLGEGKLFANLTGGPDGMTIDEKGNLYVTGPAGIWVFEPARGRLLGIIETPEHPANCCFGGPEGRTLFITARTSLYRIGLAVRGARPELAEAR